MQSKDSAASKSTDGAARERGRLRERERIMAAMLTLSGEFGYRQATVRRVLERSGTRPSQFYACFPNRAECFAAAHEAEVERLYRALIDAARRQPNWREGSRAALQELLRFAVERPLLARATLREVYVARGSALVKYEEVLERLSRAIESACRETSESRHSPPPETAAFMVGAIEEFVRSRLGARRQGQLLEATPTLMQLLVAPYLGDEVARQELDGAVISAARAKP
jgi:AcrR family transcriptional regulator